MRIALLTAQPPHNGRAPARHEIVIDVHPHGSPAGRGFDLVVVNAAKMSPDEAREALDWIQELRHREPSARIVVAWPNPPIDYVIKALRVGANDFIKEPLSVARLHRVLARCGTPSEAPRAARALIACGALLESNTFTEEEADLAAVLQRERKVHLREAAVAAETKRLEDLREVLQHRENELRLRAMRLDEEFMQLQNDADLHLASSPRFGGYEPRGSSSYGSTSVNRDDIESRERRFSDSGD
jgi:DNA-binding NarL/FixJ family response regulator